MFCAPRLVFGSSECLRFLFHVLRSQIRFRWYRGRRVPSSCFRARTRFRRYRGRRVLFSCFARPDSFSAIPTASGPVFMFCAPGLIFGGTDGVGFRFLFLHSRTRFRRYRGRRVLFSCIARLDSFSAVHTALGPVFMFCAPGLVFGGTEGLESRFHVLLSRTRFRLYR
jgi:hypothetical protein